MRSCSLFTASVAVAMSLGCGANEAAPDASFNTDGGVSHNDAAIGVMHGGDDGGTACTGPAISYENAQIEPGCSANVANGVLTAAIQNGADANDSAYRTHDFGGAMGAMNRVFVRSLVHIPSDETFSANIVLLAIHGINDETMYEFFLDAARHPCIYAAAAGGGGASQCATTTLPNDGTPQRIELSGLPGATLVLRVNGDDLTMNLPSMGTTRARYLRVGIDHYDEDSGASGSKTVLHESVGLSLTDWLGAPTTTCSTGTTANAPSVPAGLAAVAGDGTVALHWNANPAGEQVMHYQVYRNDERIADGPTSPSFMDTGLTNGFGYTYRVSAWNVSGYSDWSMATTAMPMRGP